MEPFSVRFGLQRLNIQPHANRTFAIYIDELFQGDMFIKQYKNGMQWACFGNSIRPDLITLCGNLIEEHYNFKLPYVYISLNKKAQDWEPTH